MHEIAYASPTTVDEAIQLLASPANDARILSGGTDLLIQLRAGARPDTRTLIDAKRISELDVLALDDAGLRLGAAVPCARLTRHPDVVRRYPGLTEAAGLIGSRQIQSRATLGGNLCNGSPAADTVPALIALDASAVIAGPSGRRHVAVEQFITAPGKTVLAPTELLVELLVPRPAAGCGDAYQRFIPRNEMDIAVVGVGARIALDGARCVEARIALGAVGPTPILATEAANTLIGQEIDDAVLERAAEAAMAAARPISDKRGTADFRRKIVGTLTRRVIAMAAARAKNGATP